MKKYQRRQLSLRLKCNCDEIVLFNDAPRRLVKNLERVKKCKCSHLVVNGACFDAACARAFGGFGSSLTSITLFNVQFPDERTRRDFVLKITDHCPYVDSVKVESLGRLDDASEYLRAAASATTKDLGFISGTVNVADDLPLSRKVQLLSFNHVTLTGAHNVPSKFLALRGLNFRYTILPSREAVAFFERLSDVTTLRYLRFYEETLCFVGVRCLVDWLETNDRLTLFTLCHDVLDYQPLRRLTTFIRKSHALTTFEFKGFSRFCRGYEREAFYRAVRANGSLRCFCRDDHDADMRLKREYCLQRDGVTEQIVLLLGVGHYGFGKCESGVKFLERGLLKTLTKCLR